MICVSIGRTRHKMMMIEIQEAAKQGAEMMELRLDFLARPPDFMRVLNLVKKGPKPTVGVCMGDMGVPSRILGAKFGAPFTYAAFNIERGIAPGILSFAEMKKIYQYDKLTSSAKVYAVIGDPIAH